MQKKHQLLLPFLNMQQEAEQDLLLKDCFQHMYKLIVSNISDEECEEH